MNNLVIGNTSQLSFYFPEDYVKISSRNIDLNLLKNNSWNRVYICIGESRKFIQNIKLYDDINFYLTLEIIDALKEVSRSIVIYSTCELWNQYDGQISIDNNFNFYSTPYLQSKFKISKFILDNKKDYSNVIVLYPFNFNSIHRNTNFLFGKIFNSIIEKKVVEIGDTYFYRDIIHPKFVVEKSITAHEHEIIGSGRMVYVNDFIRDIYSKFNLKYEDFIIENTKNFNEYDKRKEYYLKSNKNNYPYELLLKDTISDIKNFERSRIKNIIKN
jgi:nucleoside-diphosphate-sugar epimerase